MNVGSSKNAISPSGTDAYYQTNTFSSKNRGNDEREVIHSGIKSKFFHNILYKVDPRFISNKISHFPYTTEKKYINEPILNQQTFGFNRNFSQNYPQNQIRYENPQDYTMKVLRSLISLNRNKYAKTLGPGIDIPTEKVEESINHLDLHEDIEKMMINLKAFIGKHLITSMIDDHYENLVNLNKFLNNLNIQITETMVDDYNLNINFKQELSDIISKSNLNFFSQSLFKNLEKKNPFTLLRESHEEGFEEVKGGEKKYKIFFGDFEKMDLIYLLVKEKLENIKAQKNFQKSEFNKKSNRESDFSKFFSLKNKEVFNYNEKKEKKMHLHNPFVNKGKCNIMSDMTDQIQSSNTIQEENLKLLCRILKLRLSINDKFKPYFIDINGEEHYEIIMYFCEFLLI
jgi:hypothetical protein